MPRLLFTSPANLESRYLYTLTKETSSRTASINLKLDRELNLPQIARSWIIGSSHGHLISMPTIKGVPHNIHAINPMTGSLLHIPLTSELMMVRVKDCKATLSPSLDKVALLPNLTTRVIGLADLTSSSPLLSWTLLDIPDDLVSLLQDCVFHKDGLYVTNHLGGVAAFHIGGPSIWTDVYERKDDEWCYKSMLVQSPEGDDLYLLVRTINKHGRFKFEVFKLHRGHWKNVESIGDLAVFVARNSAITLHTHRFPLLKPNCIYFFGDDYCYKRDQNVGMYYLKSKRFKRIGANDGDQLLASNHPPPILFQPAEACPPTLPKVD